MKMCSAVCCFRSKKTFPHGSVGVGSRAVRFPATVENAVGEIRLFSNGARSAIARPALHAGEAMTEKSPASIAGVGTNANVLVGVTSTRVP